jgi:hypothetical protein
MTRYNPPPAPSEGLLAGRQGIAHFHNSAQINEVSALYYRIIQYIGY